MFLLFVVWPRYSATAVSLSILDWEKDLRGITIYPNVIINWLHPLADIPCFSLWPSLPPFKGSLPAAATTIRFSFTSQEIARTDHESAANLLYGAVHAFLAPALYTRSLHTFGSLLVPYWMILQFPKQFTIWGQSNNKKSSMTNHGTGEWFSCENRHSFFGGRFVSYESWM